VLQWYSIAQVTSLPPPPTRVEINDDADDYVIYDCDSNVPTQNSTANTMHQPASQQLTDDDTDNDNCVDNSSQLRAGRICDQGSHT